MRSAKSVGRTIGGLLLLQMVAGFMINFVLLGPAITSPPGFLETAAANPTRVSLAVILMVAMGALSIGNMILAWPIFRQYSDRMALWLVALSIAGLALAAVEGAAVMSMLSLSQEYARAEAADAQLIRTMAIIVRSGRNWAHYTHLLVGGGLIFSLHATMFRFELVPRLLAGFGMAAAILQMAVMSMTFFGTPVNFTLLAPMGFSFLALSLWLLARGFADPKGRMNANEEVKV